MSYDISKITAPTTHDLQKAQNTVNNSSQRPQKTCINRFLMVMPALSAHLAHHLEARYS